MAAQVYTTNDLLRMRKIPAEAEIQKNLRKRLKDRMGLNEIVRVTGPGHRKLGRIPEESRDISIDKDLNFLPAPVRQLDGTDSEWKYRGRSNSEDAQPQPIPAPPGLAAQKDEGFQRFYRAVVSPTHVRVTAGGRIVPNNRTTFSSNPRWAKDKARGETTPSYRAAVHAQAEHTPSQFPHVSFGPMPHLFPGFASNPGVLTPTTPQYSLVPWQMGFGIGGNMGMPLASNPAAEAGSVHKMQRYSTSSEQQSEPGLSEKPAPAALPLEFYDQTRSMFYNNHWMMPAGGPFYPIPVPSQGAGGFPVIGPVPSYGGVSKEAASTQKTSQSTQSKDHLRSSSTSKAEANPQVNGARGSLPISSIRPSEITKRHLDILRARLRYLEDQLQFNKHQIDERSVEHDAQLARQYIQQFEANFEAQLGIEEACYPKTKEMEPEHSKKLSENRDHKSFETGHGQARSEYAGYSQGSVKSETKPRQGLQSISDTSVYRQLAGSKPKLEKPDTRFSSGINSTKSVSAWAGYDPLSDTLPNSRSSNGKSKLPLGAALAPPFQPRSDVSTPNFDQVGSLGPSGNGEENMGDSRLPTTGQKMSWDIPPSPYLPYDNRMPYLSGPPHDLGPAYRVDLGYERELTEDELRARDMYWGKNAYDLQKPITGFNGQDFSSQSLQKDQSMDSSQSRELLTRETSTGNPGEQPLVADPFKLLGQSGHLFSRDGPGNSTQSESLPGPEENLQRPAATGGQPASVGLKRVGVSLDEVAPTSEFASPLRGSAEQSSGDACDEEKELIFKGRKAMQQVSKTHNRIWSSMLKKGKTSAGAVLGTVSAMTAQGVLPQYAGHATAALTPTIANQGALPRANLPTANDSLGGKTSDLLKSSNEENCPPALSNAC